MSSQIIPKERKEENKERNLIQIFYYMAWTFLGMTVLDIIIILIQGDFSFISLCVFLLFFIMAAISFSTAARIKSNPEEKQKSFRDFVISALIVGILTIIVLSAYLW